MDIREDVNHHREIEAEFQALGYEYAWQRKRWRVWRDSRYVADCSPDLHLEDRPAEGPNIPTLGKGSDDPGAVTLGDLMAVGRRCAEALRSKQRRGVCPPGSATPPRALRQQR